MEENHKNGHSDASNYAGSTSHVVNIFGSLDLYRKAFAGVKLLIWEPKEAPIASNNEPVDIVIGRLAEKRRASHRYMLQKKRRDLKEKRPVMEYGNTSIDIFLHSARDIDASSQAPSDRE